MSDASRANWYPSAGALYNAVDGGSFYIRCGASSSGYYCARRPARGPDVFFEATLAELRALVAPR